MPVPLKQYHSLVRVTVRFRTCSHNSDILHIFPPYYYMQQNKQNANID